MPGTTGLSSSPDLAAEAGVLLSVLRAASSGNDVSHMVPELLQAILSKPATNPLVRKLAYEVCRHTNLTESEYSRLWESISGDVNNNDPEVVATALRFLTCLPASQLADRLIIGQLAELLKPCLAAEAAVVRAAAVQALAHVLLQLEVQQAAASSAGLANAYEGLWDELTDSLLDERPFVVGQAAAATAQLLSAGISTATGGFSGANDATGGSASGSASGGALVGFMMSRFADRAALRLSTALGPVLEMCGLVPAPGQMAVCDMLLALTRRLLTQALRAATGAPPPPPPPPGVPTPGLASLVSSVASYLATLLQSCDAAARTEACGVVLELAADLAAAGPAAGGAAAGLPQALILAAVDALTQLREREFVEAGLGDICEALAESLPALLPPARSDVLRRLWPLAGRIDDVSRRARVFSVAWKAAVTSEMDFRTGSGAQHASGRATAGPSLGSLPAAAPPPPPSSAGSDPLGLLAGLAAAPFASAGPAGGAALEQAAAGVVTAVPPSCRVAALLGEQFVGAILSGRPPAVEVSGAFSAAQASAALVSAPSSNSLLSTVASMTRAAPPPPLSLPRMESSRSSGSGTPVEAGRAAKADKDKKSGFGARFFRSKPKARPGESDGDHAAAAAAEDAAAAKQLEGASAAALAASAAASEAAAAAHRAAAPPSPRMPVSPGGGGGGGNGALSSSPLSGASVGGDAAAAILARPLPSHATLRHELLQCLLQQLAQHPAAAAAAELGTEHAAAARHDRHPPTHPHPSSSHTSSSAASSLTCRLGGVVQWVAMASEVLADSAACVGWEPYVLPAITVNPGTSAASCAPVDFNTLTADMWLGLMQAALQAGHAAAALLGRLVAEAVEAAAAVEAAGAQRGAFAAGYGMPYGLAAAAAQQQSEVTAEAHYRALLSYLQDRSGALQGLLLKLLSGWSGLSAPVRPRVVWVAAACLPLPGHWDERWELLLGCVDALLLRGTDVLAGSRRADLMGSALAGGLFKAGRQAWTDPTKPFLFDIASASALCEAPEVEALGLLAGLAAAQQLAAVLLNGVADAVPHGAGGAAHGQAAAVAKRLEAVMRRFIGTERAAAPQVRDWCKRILRYLTTLLTYTPPLNLPPTVAALGIIAKQAHAADGIVADDDDASSDASSAYHPEEGQAELPPALAAAAAAAVAAAAAAATQPHAQLHDDDAAAANGAAPNGEAAAAAEGAGTAEEAGKQRTPPVNSYLVHSAAAAVPMWGYPFAALSAVSLHNSKRARRHRALRQHLAAAAAAARAPRPVMAAALLTLQPPQDDPATGSPASGPALSGSSSQFRLDSESFWSALPASHSPWQELTGPADPLLLRGCYVRPDPARGDAATITVMLSAANRLPVDISDVEVALKSSGPLLSSTRRAATWALPRLAAHDRAVASFTFKVLGYGDLQLHARLQLCPGPARVDSSPLQLNCLPLEVPGAVLMRSPRVRMEAADFFKSWGSLPARTELSGVCTWPGPEGGALLLSALLRQPLWATWLQHVPALVGFQAAFAADTALGDSLAMVVLTQMMPPPAPGGAAETFCTFSIRSSSPDLILCLQAGAAAWLSQLTAGTASLGGAGRAAQPAPSAKPPLHPRVAALLQSYSASAAQLAPSCGSTLVPLGSFGLAATSVAAAAAAAVAGGGGGGVEAGARGGASGGGLAAVQLKNAALLEWQRLSSLAV